MRVTNQMRYSQSLLSMRRRSESMTRVHRELTSGTRVRQASDDPAASARILTLGSRVSRTMQYQRNLESARSRLSVNEQSLGTLNDLLSQARSIAVQGASSASSAADRVILANESDQVIQRLVAEANRHFVGQSIFGGSAGNVDPFLVTTDDGGQITRVRLNPEGGKGVQIREVDEGERMRVDLGGEGVFMAGGEGSDSDLFQLLFDLRGALSGDDPAAVGDTLDRFDALSEHVSTERSAVGQKLQRLDRLENRLQLQEIDLEDSLSELRDTDMAEAATEYALEQTAYEAALRTASDVMTMSLMNFLR